MRALPSLLCYPYSSYPNPGSPSRDNLLEVARAWLLKQCCGMRAQTSRVGSERQQRGTWMMGRGICGGSRGIGFVGGSVESMGRRRMLRGVGTRGEGEWERGCKTLMSGRFQRHRRTSHLCLISVVQYKREGIDKYHCQGHQ
jgi:hypothetical protein